MEAGRELDAEVATKVMGWRDVQPRKWQDNAPVPDQWGIPTGVDPVDGQIVIIPDYSTRIADAWQVVEHMRLWVFPHNGGWYAGVELDHTRDYVYVDIEVGIVDGHLAHLACADTAPLAICRAALAAATQ